MKKIFILSLLLCILSPLTFAKSYTRFAYIEEIVVSEEPYYSDGANWMRIKTSDMANGEGCSNTNWLHLDVENDPERAMFAAVLSAQAAGSQVYFQLIGCRDFDPNDSNTFADITHVYVD